jgi:hypothetical protein
MQFEFPENRIVKYSSLDPLLASDSCSLFNRSATISLKYFSTRASFAVTFHEGHSGLRGGTHALYETYSPQKGISTSDWYSGGTQIPDINPVPLAASHSLYSP